jgi:hypothetical protein
MTVMFRTDTDRALAIELRRLLMRLQNGDGEDPGLGADIREAFELPHTMGDPIGCIDCALWLADHLKASRVEALDCATGALKERCRDGWKSADQITHADAARAITGILLKGKIAKLEGTPA